MSGYDQKAVARLESVCAMLASPNDGERANAAMMASRMLGQLGLDWREVVRRAFAGRRPETARPAPQCDDGSGRALYAEILRWDGLTDWERSLVHNLYIQHPKVPSEKQSVYLRKIIRKYERSHHAV